MCSSDLGAASLMNRAPGPFKTPPRTRKGAKIRRPVRSRNKRGKSAFYGNGTKRRAKRGFRKMVGSTGGDFLSALKASRNGLRKTAGPPARKPPTGGSFGGGGGGSGARIRTRLFFLG